MAGFLNGRHEAKPAMDLQEWRPVRRGVPDIKADLRVLEIRFSITKCADIQLFMTEAESDLQADIPADRGEVPSQMEPLVLRLESRQRPHLADLALELAQKSARFRHSLPQPIVSSLAGLVRSMNCYYSNLIEGHDTHPVEIERALAGDLSSDTRKRDLQLEARAHIAVQRWIDDGALAGGTVTVDAIREVHRRFYAELPESLRFVEAPGGAARLEVVPGQLRQRDVAVGRHVAVGPRALPRFLKRYEEAYGRLGTMETVLATAAAHHRLVWIHPFLDGNGRVARLLSHATLTERLGTGALWSVARGLARSVGEYKAHLAACDLRRRNDLDGRGNLSEEALEEFTRYFLACCIDQVAFMEGLMQPERLRARVLLWAEEEIRAGRLPARASAVLGALLHRGELPRGEVAGLVATGDRQARRVASALLDRGVATAASSRAPLRLAFPASLAGRWMPGLFPEA